MTEKLAMAMKSDAADGADILAAIGAAVGDLLLKAQEFGDALLCAKLQEAADRVSALHRES